MAFKIEDGAHHFYRADVDSELRAVFTPKQRASWTPEAREKAIAFAAPDLVEVKGLAGIREMTQFVSEWNTRVTKTQDARRAEVIAAINAGEDLEEVKIASGVTWDTIAAWAFPVKKEPTVNEEAGKAITAILDARRITKEARKKKAEALKDPSSPYAELVAEIRRRKDEYLVVAGQAYKEDEGMDEALDGLVEKERYFFG